MSDRVLRAGGETTDDRVACEAGARRCRLATGGRTDGRMAGDRRRDIRPHSGEKSITASLNARQCREQRQVHAGKEDRSRPGWTTSIRGPDSAWKSQSE